MAKTTQLASAALPLTGAELIPIVQAGVSRKVTSQSVAALGGEKGDPGGDASQVGTRLQAETMNFAAGIDMIRTTGFATRGDGGAATYVRWAAPMTALIANQEGYSWFEAGDGSRWLVSEINLRPEMFGALGNNNADDGPALRRLSEFAPGRSVIVTKAYRYKSTSDAEAIRFYSNTKWQGISALISGFVRIPNAIGETTDQLGLYCEDADELEISDLFHDVSRSGLGQPNATARRVNGFLIRGRNGRVRLNRLLVLNATGYAFYIGAVGNSFSTDTIITDCTAINSQVSFEITGKDTKARTIRARSLQYVTDGGAVVPPECGFHEYGGIAGAYHEKPFHRGNAPAVLSVLTDEFENRGVVYEKPDFEINLPGIAAAIVRNDAFGANGKRAQAEFIDGRIVNLNGPATDFTFALVKVHGTQLLGRTAALSVGANSIVALSADFDVECIEPATTPVGAAAIAAVIDVSAVCTRTPSGSIKATHLNGGPEVAVSGNIILVDDTVFDPPLGGGPLVDVTPIRRQYLQQTRVIGPDPSVNFYQNTATHYYASILLPLEPLDWNKVGIGQMGFWAGFGNTAPPPDITIVTNPRADVSPNEIFVSIKTSGAIPAGYTLRYEIWENV